MELQAEQIEQAMLARVLDRLLSRGPADTGSAISAVAAFYARWAGKQIRAEADAALRVLRDAVLADRSSA